MTEIIKTGETNTSKLSNTKKLRIKTTGSTMSGGNIRIKMKF